MVARAFAVWALVVLLASQPVAAVSIPLLDGHVISTTVDGPVCLRVADIDADGDPDLVGADYWSAEVYWKENHGNGSYTHHSVGTDLDATWIVEVGDIDGDGDLDIVAGSRDSDDATEASWYANPLHGSNASWTQHGMLSLASQGVFDIALGDIDRDGDLDVAFATDGSADTDLIWRANSGTGLAWTHHTIDNLESSDGAAGTILTDVDGDGDLDLVAALADANVIGWWENDGGSPPMDSWTPHTIDSSANGGRYLAAGDMDRDGDMDIVAALHEADAVVWYEQGGGSWTEHTIRASFGGAWSVALADVDMDADLDVLATAYEADLVAWFENTLGDGSDWLIHGVEAEFDGAKWVVVQDYDGDGDPDIAAAAYLDDTIMSWRNETIHRRYGFDDHTVIRDTIIGADAIDAGDINGDGLPDVVASAYSSNSIIAFYGVTAMASTWFQQEVNGSFDGVDDVHLADLDADGDLDIIASATYDDQVAVWFNDGAALPSWSRTTLLSAFDGMSVTTGDMDDDGDLDVVAAGFVDDTVTWLENGNSWMRHDLRTDIDGAARVRVADLNGDGWQDVVVSAAVGDRVVVLFNFDGSGTIWWEEELVTAWDGPRGLDIVDVDSDGDLDVVAVAFEDEIRWFENTGNIQVWNSHLLSDAVIDPLGVAAGDFDSDGDMDVVAIEDDGRFLWWNGPDHLGPGHLNMSGPRDFAVCDIDRDGFLDFALAVDAATAGGVDDTIGWIRNRGGQYSTPTFATNDHQWGNDESKAVFSLLLFHNGRPGDTSIEFEGFEVRLEDGAGSPLTHAQANNVFDRMEVFLEANGNYEWDAGDLEILQLATLTPTASGNQTIELPDVASQVIMAPETSRRYYVVLTTTTDAGNHSPSWVQLFFDERTIVVEDAEHDIELRGYQAADHLESTRVIPFVGPMFADGFESGDTSAWSPP